MVKRKQENEKTEKYDIFEKAKSMSKKAFRIHS